MLTFFWCLFTLSLFIIIWNQIRHVNLPFSLFLIVIDLTHSFALYGILDHKHALLKNTGIWLHQVLFLIWITWRYKVLNQEKSSFSSVRLAIQWGYVGTSLVFLYLTLPCLLYTSPSPRD